MAALGVSGNPTKRSFTIQCEKLDNPIYSGAGTNVTVVGQQDGFYAPFVTGPAMITLSPVTANTNDFTQIISDYFTRSSYSPSLAGYFTYGANSGLYRWWFGYFDSDPSQTDSPHNGVGFLVSPSKGKNIQAVSCKNGVCTYVDTGVQGLFNSLSQPHTYTILGAANGLSFNYYIDNAHLKIIKTNIPDSAANLKMYASMTRLSATSLNESSSLMTSKVYGESN